MPKRDLPKPLAHIPLMCNDVYWVEMHRMGITIQKAIML